MARRLLGCWMVVVLLELTTNRAEALTLAVTEFLNNPDGTGNSLEWIELFNYGLSSIDLTNVTVSDNFGTFTFTSGASIASGEYIILANNDTDFQAEWPTVTAQVFDTTLALSDTSDEIVVKDSGGNTLWQLDYGNDEDEGRATFLAVDDFSFKDYLDDTSSAGIDRDGNDISGDLGYESNLATTDSLAFSSETTLSATFDVGSPGAGGHSVVPEPSSLLIHAGLAATLWGLAQLRRGRRQDAVR